MSQRSAAIIIGMSETGLGAIRLLGRAAVRCYGVDTIGPTPAYRSRYCRGTVRLTDRASDAEIVQAVCDLSARSDLHRPVLVPTSDRFVRLISREREKLLPTCHLLLPPHELIEDLLDKDRFATRALAAGANLPRSAPTRGLQGLPEIISRLGLPLILKPARHEWIGVAGVPKIILVDREDEVADLQRAFAHCNEVQFVAQEYVPGGDRQHLSVAVCLDRKSQIVAAFAARKRRQSNHGAGVGTYVESFSDAEAEQAAVACLQRLGHQGLAEVEFKRHVNTGRLYMIEINPRVWTQVLLPGACGLNFPYLHFCLAAGLPLSPQLKIPSSKAWQDLWDDFYWTFRRGGYIATGDASRLGWIRETLRAPAGPYFAFDDPAPACHRFSSIAGQLLKQGLTKLRGSKGKPHDPQ